MIEISEWKCQAYPNNVIYKCLSKNDCFHPVIGCTELKLLICTIYRFYMDIIHCRMTLYGPYPLIFSWARTKTDEKSYYVILQFLGIELRLISIFPFNETHPHILAREFTSDVCFHLFTFCNPSIVKVSGNFRACNFELCLFMCNMIPIVVRVRMNDVHSLIKIHQISC